MMIDSGQVLDARALPYILHLQHSVKIIFVIGRGEQVSKVLKEKYLCEASQLLVILDNVNVPFS